MTDERETHKEEVAALLRDVAAVEDVRFVDHGGDVVALELRTLQRNGDRFIFRAACRADALAFEIAGRSGCRADCGHSAEEHAAFDAGVSAGEAGVGTWSVPDKYARDSPLREAWLTGHSVGTLNRKAAAK